MTFVQRCVPAGLSPHSEFISKYNVGLKILLHVGLSEPEFYGPLVYKFRKIVGDSDFSVQFKKIVTRYKKICYNMDTLRPTAWLLTQLWLITFLPSLNAWRWVGPQTEWWLPPQSVSEGRCLSIYVSGHIHRDPVYGFLMLWPNLAIDPFALFYHGVFDFMCVNYDVSQMSQRTPVRTEHIQSTLVISKSKGLDELLRYIHTST